MRTKKRSERAPGASVTKARLATPKARDRCGVFVVAPERVRQGSQGILPDDVNADIAATFKVLAHPTRIRIIQALSAGELCVCELSEAVQLSVSATSHQLHLLRNLRLVRARSEGKLVHYTLSDPFVVALLEDCTRHVTRKVERE